MRWGTALVAVDTDAITITDSGTVVVRNTRASGSVGYGSATCITSDGYFLTAAHVVSPRDERHCIHLVFFGDRARHVEARVVWVGDPEHGPDVALLHAPGLGAYPIEWNDPDKILPGTDTLLAGYGVVPGSESMTFASGIVLDAEKAWDAAGRSYTIITTSSPQIPGDSGGPVVCEHGHLLGVVVSNEISFTKYRLRKYIGISYSSRVDRPDPCFIDELISRDRARVGQKRADADQ